MTLRTLRETPARSLTTLTSLLLAAGLLAGCSSAADTGDAAETTTPTASESSASEEPSAPADGSSAEAPEFSYEGEEGSMALDLLLAADPTAEVTGEGENAYVTAIDGITADPESEFWALYVNGEMATVGAGMLETKDGDEITWKLETFTS
ncbi:DUF4430 domain-containing protein [Cellulosimicrobium sp. PMB13]|uniref:DUF4430 domain-containing protein n=1 Tax=Cellulosimicrobium sp. PMB13 TaxID=3120158 RepID=UPI003F4B95D3